MLIALILVYVTIILFIRRAISDLNSKVILYIFSGYWMISLIASTFSPYGLFKIENSTYMILLLGPVSFVLGMASTKINKTVASLYDNKVKAINYGLKSLLSSRWLLVCYVAASLFCLVFARQALYVAYMQSHAEMIDQYELIFRGNNLAQNIFGYIITPLFHIMLMLLTYWIVNIKEIGLKNIVQVVVYLVFFASFMLISGGRSVFMIAFLYLVIVYLMTTPRSRFIKISFRSIIITLLSLYVAFLGFTAMNNYRETGEFTVNNKTTANDEFFAGEFMVRYSELPLVLFDKALQRDYVTQYGGHKMGRATFAGADGWFAWVFKHLNVPYKSTSFIVQDLQDNYIEYAPGKSGNYAYTGVFFHYLDFGIIGVIFFPFIFGYSYRRLIKNYYKSPKITYLLLICLGFFMMMHSIFTCYFIKGWVVIYIVVLFIISSYEGIKIRKI